MYFHSVFEGILLGTHSSKHPHPNIFSDTYPFILQQNTEKNGCMEEV